MLLVHPGGPWMNIKALWIALFMGGLTAALLIILICRLLR